MNKKILSITFLLLLTFVIIIQSQRGGGGSRSRSSSRSSFGRRSSWGWGSSSTNKQTSSSAGWFEYFIIAIILGSIGIAFFYGNQSQKKRKQKIKKIMNQYQGRCQQNMCVLDDTQKIKIIDWFMNHNWRIDFRAVNVWQNSYAIKVTDLKKINDIKYQIKINGTDTIGQSTSQGILTLQKDYVALFFEKSYSNRSNAGQTGQYDVLLYDGVQRGQQFYGKWYYNGFQGSPDYSGQWRMTHN